MKRTVMLLAASSIFFSSITAFAQSSQPNILVIWGDDIGIENISYNNRGMMGYQTPNIDRIAKEGLGFTDYYAQQSCTAGRAAFIGGSVPIRNGMTKVGLPDYPPSQTPGSFNLTKMQKQIEDMSTGKQ